MYSIIIQPDAKKKKTHLPSLKIKKYSLKFGVKVEWNRAGSTESVENVFGSRSFLSELEKRDG